MVGGKDLCINDDNCLQFKIGRNSASVNTVFVGLRADDTYYLWDLINCVPPLNFGSGYFQCGEPHSFVNGKQTYLTLLRVNKEPEVWQFLGYCHAGQTVTPDKE